MKKQVTIDACIECKNVDQYMVFKKEDFKGFSKGTLLVATHEGYMHAGCTLKEKPCHLNTIPDWCPLEDVE